MGELTRLLDKYKKVGLSDTDLLALVEGKGKVVRYRDLVNYKNLEDLLDPHNVVFILYEWKEANGHWVLVLRNSVGEIEYFDPYGEFIDEPLKAIAQPFKTESGQEDKTLSKLLLDYPGDLSYNELQFQKLDIDIRDCGRWCVIRALLKDMDLYSFEDLFLNDHGDDLVTFLTTSF